MNFISNITIRTKILSIVIALTLPIAYLSYMYVNDSLSAINNKKMEHVGLDYQELVRPLLKDIAQHRGITASFLSKEEDNKDDADKGKIDVVKNNIDVNLEAIVNFQKEWSSTFKLDESLDEIKSEWMSLSEKNLTIRKRENFDRHSLLVKKVQKYLSQIAYSSGLKTDANPVTSYLVQLTTVNQCARWFR